jgi:diguanylate cyclase (GGDEF)-like protein/PAS domain S-box-containing protein
MSAMSGAPTVRVLLAEDVASDAELEVRELKRGGLGVRHRVVDDERSFEQALREFAPDVILSDFSMPAFDGMAALALARELCPETPFIFVSGTIGEEYAIRALKSGATDYVLKANLVRLPAAVERALAEAQERRELRRTEVELELARERLTSIFTSLPDMLWSVDAQTRRYLYVSPATKEIFGVDPEELLRRQDLANELVHPKDRPIAAQAWQRVEQDGGFDVDYRIVRPGASVRWINNRARLIRNAKGVAERIDGLARDITEKIEQRDRILYLARYDALTGLPNRTLFHERLTQAIEAARGGKETIALVLVDLERFKAINDTLGQQVGDRVLRDVGKRLQDAAGDLHRVARLGANLFALMFQQLRAAEEVARRIETLFTAPFEVEGREVRLAAKAGIAVFPEDGGDADALFRNAEAALKRAKETGERYLFYAPEINARVSEQVELEHRLRKAVEQGELFLHFQPKFDLATRSIVGVEALMRWRSPDGGLVSPAKFVPVLEQTGLIFEAGQQVLAAAKRTYRLWKTRGLNAPRIAVNVSALQLRRKSFVADVRAALGDVEADGEGVDLEVTESLLMTDVDESIRKLRELREMGLHMALDDFGTGYSSLAYLSKLPLDTLKIDRSFVHGMTEHADTTSIISTIISLAQGLRLKVVAEGVETEQQAQLLRLLRCDQVQGFLFSPPVPAEKIETLL